MSRFKMETSPLVKNSFKGKRNEREKIPFNGFPDSRYPITGGPIATYDMNGVLQPGYADKPSIEGCRYATTVAEGATVVNQDVTVDNLSSGITDNGDGSFTVSEAIGSKSYVYISFDNISPVIGTRVQINFSISAVNAGSITPRVAGSVYGTAQENIGDYTEELVFDTSLNVFYLRVSSAFVGTFSLGVVREVIPQWVPNIGSRNGSSHFAANYQMFRTYWSADPKAWLESQG